MEILIEKNLNITHIHKKTSANQTDVSVFRLSALSEAIHTGIAYLILLFFSDWLFNNMVAEVILFF